MNEIETFCQTFEKEEKNEVYQLIVSQCS